MDIELHWLECVECGKRCLNIKHTFDGQGFKCTKCVKNDPMYLYKLRNLALKQIGFNKYDEYLKSPIWQTIREIVLKRDNNKCALCGNSGNIVHHQSYAPEVLIGKVLRLLHTLCNECHYNIEFDYRKNKRSIHLVNRFFRRCIRKSTTPKKLNDELFLKEEMIRIESEKPKIKIKFIPGEYTKKLLESIRSKPSGHIGQHSTEMPTV